MLKESGKKKKKKKKKEEEEEKKEKKKDEKKEEEGCRLPGSKNTLKRVINWYNPRERNDTTRMMLTTAKIFGEEIKYLSCIRESKKVNW